MVEILAKKLRNALIAAAFGDADMKIERLAPALMGWTPLDGIDVPRW
jgi:hypothetical protein